MLADVVADAAGQAIDLLHRLFDRLLIVAMLLAHGFQFAGVGHDDGRRRFGPGRGAAEQPHADGAEHELHDGDDEEDVDSELITVGHCTCLYRSCEIRPSTRCREIVLRGRRAVPATTRI